MGGLGRKRVHRVVTIVPMTKVNKNRQKMKKKNAPGILSRLFVISPAPPPHSCSHVVPVLLVGKVVTKEIEKKNLRGV